MCMKKAQAPVPISTPATKERTIFIHRSEGRRLLCLRLAIKHTLTSHRIKLLQLQLAVAEFWILRCRVKVAGAGSRDKLDNRTHTGVLSLQCKFIQGLLKPKLLNSPQTSCGDTHPYEVLPHR